MTSLSRRKRPITARRITPTRTIASLLCWGGLAGGLAAADPQVPLRPLNPPLPAADLADPAPLVPAAKPLALPAPKMLYYQKDAAPPAKPVALPMANMFPITGPELTIHQEQAPQPAQPGAVPVKESQGIIQLFRKAVQTQTPNISDIGLKTEADEQRDIIRDVEQIADIDLQQRATFTYFPKDTDFPAEYRPLFAELKRPYVARVLPPTMERVEPAYVIYKRLYFQDVNSERYGWEMGPFQPVISAALFYKDVLFLPYHIGTRPCQCYETSAGYCLPGDPVPYLLYPPELSATGALLQAGTVVGLAAPFGI